MFRIAPKYIDTWMQVIRTEKKNRSSGTVDPICGGQAPPHDDFAASARLLSPLAFRILVISLPISLLMRLCISGL